MLVTDLPLDLLQSHPSQFMFHDLGGTEWDELVSDVRERGIQQPITVSRRTGQYTIVDGHQRARAARKAGLTTIPAVQQAYEDERAETLALVMANIRRRHLTRDERRQVIAEMLKLYPEKSNRQHAESLGVDHKTVKTQRQEMEATGEIPQLKQTTGADGRTRTTAPKRTESPRSIPPTPQQQPEPVQELLPAKPAATPPPAPQREIWEVNPDTPIDLTPTPFAQHLQEIGYEEARSFENCAQKVIAALSALNHYSKGDLIQIAQSKAGRGMYAHLRLQRIHELLQELGPKLDEDDQAGRVIDAERLN